MSTPFLWTHWGHLGTKPAQSLALFLPLRWLGVGPWLAVGVALAAPALVSAVRKQILWPGCFRHLDVWKDEVADTWAAGIAVVPLALGGTWGLVALGVGLLVLVGGLHRWALP